MIIVTPCPIVDMLLSYPGFYFIINCLISLHYRTTNVTKAYLVSAIFQILLHLSRYLYSFIAVCIFV